MNSVVFLIEKCLIEFKNLCPLLYSLTLFLVFLNTFILSYPFHPPFIPLSLIMIFKIRYILQMKAKIMYAKIKLYFDYIRKKYQKSVLKISFFYVHIDKTYFILLIS